MVKRNYQDKMITLEAPQRDLNYSLFFRFRFFAP
jgi:hypothetical protein